MLSTEIRRFQRQLDLEIIVAHVVDYYRRSFTGSDDTEFTDVGEGSREVIHVSIGILRPIEGLSHQNRLYCPCQERNRNERNAATRITQ